MKAQKKRSNILITGARVFIGKTLVEHLSRSPGTFSLFCPYRKELDLLDSEKVADFITKNGIDVIVHCASTGGQRKTAYDMGVADVISTNLRMFFNLARSMDEVERMIFLGTGAEYDKRHYLPKMKEDHFGSHIPADDYGFSKYVCSKFIESSKKMVNLRLFGMFGPYEDYEYKFISNAVVKNLLKLPITINQNVYFDQLYVKDCVKIIEHFILNKPKHNIYNVTTGTTIDLVTIAKKINEMSDFRSEIIIKNPGLNTEYSGDNSRLMKEIDPKFTRFEEALRELFDHYRSILPSIDRGAIEKDEFIKFCKVKKG